VSKLTDCDDENGETDSWLDFAYSCGYLSSECFERLSQQCKQIGNMLGAVLRNPKQFLLKTED
jgi:four helix bundle protein